MILDELHQDDDLLYPTRLNDLPDPPETLYVMGEANLNAPSVAFVGSRSATQYGLHVTTDLVQQCVEQGLTIVSGGAYGIDAAAHRAALAAGGKTIVVLAGGLDCTYPQAHGPLFQEVLNKGGALITEKPHGTIPAGSMFLERNRIIAAMSDAMIVVEGSMRSGTKNAARNASELERPVGAVPGPITSMHSFLPNALIRRGMAKLVTDARDIIPMVCI